MTEIALMTIGCLIIAGLVIALVADRPWWWLAAATVLLVAAKLISNGTIPTT